MGRGVVKISGDLFIDILTQGWGGNEWVRCIEGLPKGTKCVDMFIQVDGPMDNPSLTLGMCVEHDDLVNNEDYCPVMQSTEFESYSAYKVRELETGYFITKSGIPKTRGELMDFATARTIADYLGEDKAELVEYKLIEWGE